MSSHRTHRRAQSAVGLLAILLVFGLTCAAGVWWQTGGRLPGSSGSERGLRRLDPLEFYKWFTGADHAENGRGTLARFKNSTKTWRIQYRSDWKRSMTDRNRKMREWDQQFESVTRRNR